ncbi:MAG: hypothetical protein HZB38_19310 [Planctomycetes bacterium]|nr:hypothetical protein [Planctomycetota bacterium]
MIAAKLALVGFGLAGWGANRAFATVEDYESFTEGSLGLTFASNGATYRDANLVGGVFPDGSTFSPGELGSQYIIEQATAFYNDFPTYGSPVNALTFGSAYVPGDNLTIGALASVWMDLAAPAEAASLDIAYYENGPWGGIEYHLDALLGGQVVAGDSFVISNFGGRDNPTFSSLSVTAVSFDSLHLYARFGGEYSAPRGMIDDLSLTPAQAACPGDLDGDGSVGLNDLARLLSNFGTSSGGTSEQGDSDGDGDIDLSDLSALLGAFGTTC